MGPQQTVTNFHTDSRASLRSAAGSSACPRCAAGRYAAGIKRASDGWWGERSHQFMIRTMRSSRLEWGGGPTWRVGSVLLGVKGAARRCAMASGHP
jgi:hypothetical protein